MTHSQTAREAAEEIASTIVNRIYWRPDEGEIFHIKHVTEMLLDRFPDVTQAASSTPAAVAPPAEGKTLGQIAHKKYAIYQLHIPRMEIRPLTWEELKACNNGDICQQWEEIAQAVADAATHTNNMRWTAACDQYKELLRKARAEILDLRQRAENAEYMLREKMGVDAAPESK